MSPINQIQALLPTNRLARKVIKALVLFSAMLTLVITAVQLWLEYRRDISNIDAQFQLVERSYLDPVAEVTWRADTAGMKLLLDGIAEIPDFAYVEVRDESGAPVMAIGERVKGDSRDQSYPLNYRFRDRDRFIGTLEVNATMEGVYARLWDRVWVILAFNTLKTALVAAFLFTLVYWMVTRHLDAMARFARAMSFDGECEDIDLKRGPLCGGRDEIDDLASALNEMKVNLTQSYADQQQLSEELEIRVRGRTKALAEEAAMHRRTAQKLAVREARLLDIAEAGSDWIWETGPDLRFTYHSKDGMSEGPLGTDSTDMLGRTRMELALDLEEVEKWADHQDALMHRRPFRDFVYRQADPTGKMLYVRTSGKPTFSETGEFQGYRGISSDITAQVLAEQRAEQTADQLRVLSSAIEQNPSAVFITDTEGTIQFVNDKFTEVTGYQSEDVVGKNPRILKSPFTSPKVHKAIWDHITAGQEWRGELQDQRRDGSIFWAYATIAPVKNANGEITHFVATHEDITQRKEDELRLVEATERAEVANRTKSEIMANMSHELRTPLNAIIGFSDTIMNETFGALNNERYEDYIKDIKDSGVHLLALINDILDVSAIEAGKLQLRPERIEVGHLVESSLKLVGHRAQATGVELACYLEDDLPIITADARRIKQVLLNLLSNAVKFTPADGRVILSARRSKRGDGVCFEVEDTGIGMDAAGVETALTQFGQVDSKLARKYEGTGLGLPLTKSLVELHGGTLDIRSQPGSGTLVTVELPLVCRTSDQDTPVSLDGARKSTPKLVG